MTSIRVFSLIFVFVVLNLSSCAPLSVAQAPPQSSSVPSPTASPVENTSPSVCSFPEIEKVTLTGQVLDQSKKTPIHAATVILRLGDQTNSPSLCPAGATLAQVQTSADGKYQVQAPLGFEINLVVSKVGYLATKRVEVVNGRVGPGINVFDFALMPSASEGFPSH